MLKRFGGDDALIDALKRWPSSPRFSDREKAALKLAEHMTEKPKEEVSDALWNELRHYYDEGEICEIGAVIGFFNYANRFNNAFAVEPTV